MNRNAVIHILRVQALHTGSKHLLGSSTSSPSSSGAPSLGFPRDCGLRSISVVFLRRDEHKHAERERDSEFFSASSFGRRMPSLSTVDFHLYHDEAESMAFNFSCFFFFSSSLLDGLSCLQSLGIPRCFFARNNACAEQEGSVAFNAISNMPDPKVLTAGISKDITGFVRLITTYPPIHKRHLCFFFSSPAFFSSFFSSS